MRMSQLFGRTLRQTPAEVTTRSQQLMLRAGLIRQHAGGLVSYLPLGWQVQRKLMHIMREEMDGVGGQEIQLPLMMPSFAGRAWETGQASTPDGPHSGPAGRTRPDLACSPCREQLVADLLRTEVQSHRQLPLVLYHFQPTFADETQARDALQRVRGVTMLAGYSFHTDIASLSATYERMIALYASILDRCGIQAKLVAVDPAGDTQVSAHVLAVLSEQGDDTLVSCSGCSYAATVEAAAFHRSDGVIQEEGAIEPVATPGCKTIADVAAFVGVRASQTLKALLYSTPSGEIVMALLRGDLEANLAKLSHALGGTELYAASESTLRAAGLVPGYVSPVGLRGIRVVGDDSIALGSNFVCGANREGFHLRNVNFPRDFQVEIMIDIAQACAGDACPQCDAPLEMHRAFNVGHLAKLGTRYTDEAGATYLDSKGSTLRIVMGAYGLDMDRIMTMIVEQHHDERGIAWPEDVTPYQFHVVSLAAGSDDVGRAAERLYGLLLRAGCDVLYDDRDERGGGKFSDADLIGIPWRFVVSRKTEAQRSVEIKRRSEESARLVPADELVRMLPSLVAGSVC